jgi:hypothetical protein
MAFPVRARPLSSYRPDNECLGPAATTYRVGPQLPQWGKAGSRAILPVAARLEDRKQHFVARRGRSIGRQVQGRSLCVLVQAGRDSHAGTGPCSTFVREN